MQRFTAVKQTKTYAEIVDQISSHIESGVLKPGERLPAERTLSQTLAIGRQTLREALSVLEALGLIEVKHGIGTFVRQDALSRLPFAPIIEEVNADNPFEFLEARRAIEPEMAALAAKRSSEAEIADMETALAALLAEGNGQREHELDRRLHLAFARGAHNDILFRSLSAVTEQMSTHMWRAMKEKSLEADGWEETFRREHEAVLAAVKRRDHKAAHSAMLAHLKSVERSFLRK